jgi:hypothetical protein
MAAPNKTDSILIVNSNTVLAQSIATQLLQPVARRAFQILQSRSSIEHGQFPLRYRGGWRAISLAGRPDFRRFLGESPDHPLIVMGSVNNVKRYY